MITVIDRHVKIVYRPVKFYLPARQIAIETQSQLREVPPSSLKPSLHFVRLRSFFAYAPFPASPSPQIPQIPFEPTKIPKTHFLNT